MQPPNRRAWVEIDLGALQRNAATIAERSRAPLLPMIKADGYGLGAVPIARVLESLSPWGFGVATIREGIELRAAGITRPLVVFTPLADDELGDVRLAGLTPSLARRESIARWNADGGGPWHLSIDTGMSRAGVRWDEVDSICSAVRECPPQGAYTHFHSADANDGSRQEQERRFRDAVAALPERPPVLHVENSAALERGERSEWDCVRPGIFLYGVGGASAALEPDPVVRMQACIVDLRHVRAGETVSYGAAYRAVGDRRIATLSVGYADGYPRSLSNRGGALVAGRRVCVAGVVTMDMTMIDVTEVPCALGDVATLIGGRGTELGVAAVARTADMSPYELLTGLRGRIARVYRADGVPA